MMSYGNDSDDKRSKASGPSEQEPNEAKRRKLVVGNDNIGGGFVNQSHRNVLESPSSSNADRSKLNFGYNDILGLQPQTGMMMSQGNQGFFNPVGTNQDNNLQQFLSFQNQSMFSQSGSNGVPAESLSPMPGNAGNQMTGSQHQSMQSQLAALRQAVSQNQLMQQTQSATSMLPQVSTMPQGIMQNSTSFLGTSFTPSTVVAPPGLGQGLQSIRDGSFLAQGLPDFGTSDRKALSSKEGEKLSGRSPETLFMSCDDESLSEYQCLVRKQIELFEARKEEVESNAKGRNKPIVLGQVGIRCRHCSMLPPKHRARGAMYYPAKLTGLYQAAQSMASGHLCHHCQHIPPGIRQELLILRERKSSAGGGKKYWGDGVQVLGVFEDTDGLRFKKR